MAEKAYYITQGIMKKLFIALLLGSTLTLNAAVKAAKIDRIEPTDWFVGMHDPHLQLMVYGKKRMITGI